MKKIILSAVLLGLGVVSFGQEKSSMDAKPSMEQRKQEKLDKMKEDLNLTDAQLKEIVAINNKREEDIKQLMVAQREQRSKIMKENEEAIKKILTPEQIKKMEELSNSKGPRQVGGLERKK